LTIHTPGYKEGTCWLTAHLHVWRHWLRPFLFQHSTSKLNLRFYAIIYLNTLCNLDFNFYNIFNAQTANWISTCKCRVRINDSVRLKSNGSLYCPTVTAVLFFLLMVYFGIGFERCMRSSSFMQVYSTTVVW
jgi:hypothetical protein